MTAREKLIQEIAQVPEELVEEMLDFLLFARSRRSKIQAPKLTQPRPYALCKGEFIVPKNFDDPLPEDLLQDFENPS